MEDNEEYAKLLSSINIAGTGLKRPLSPIQTAEYIQRLYDEEGSDTAKLLLPIATKITSDFLNLLKLPEQCRDAIIWGKSQDVGVGFSAASSISSLDKIDDQLLLFKEASNQSLDVPDIREIISFYKKNDLSLTEVIEKIELKGNKRKIINILKDKFFTFFNSIKSYLGVVCQFSFTFCI